MKTSISYIYMYKDWIFVRDDTMPFSPREREEISKTNQPIYMYMLHTHTTDLDSYIWGFGRLWGLFDKREVKIRITGKRIVPLKRLKELVTYDKKHATHTNLQHITDSQE